MVGFAADTEPGALAREGTGRLQQFLPDRSTIALIGERTPVADRVPEPILVLIHAKSGTTNTVSLWR